jgi:hypothetical protein
MDLRTWLSVEIATVEAALQGQGPTCQLDRQHATPSSLKETEGRYAILRRAQRLLEGGQPLAALDSEAAKARTALASDRGLVRDPAWQAYFRGVLGAVEDLARQAGSLSGAAGPQRD